MTQRKTASYFTLASGQEPKAELEVKRSRFIARLGHVVTESEAKEFVKATRERHRDARHHVVAWLLANGRQWSTDDGEPQGTGGHPVLAVLEGAGLKDVICVVTRYFGGTLLGAGGLVRAYGDAARAALDTAKKSHALVRMALGVTVFADIPYGLYDRVVHMALACQGHIVERLFAQDVTLTIHFPLGAQDAFMSAMSELGNGEELCRMGEVRYREFP